jgi:hypothetical protein
VCSSSHLYACLRCGFNSTVCCSSQPYSVLSLWSLCKGERLQLVEIPRKREKEISKEKLWYSSWSLDHLKGVECKPRPLGRHNVEVGKCYLAEPRDKNRVSLVWISLWLSCPQELASQLLSSTNISITKFLWLLVIEFLQDHLFTLPLGALNHTSFYVDKSSEKTRKIPFSASAKTHERV